MRKLLLTFSVIISAIFFAACNHSDNPRPFKGFWQASVPIDSINGNSQFFIRLDFYDSTVCVDGFENTLGVMSIALDQAVYKTITADVIKEVNIINENEADIKYVQQSSGQLWSGKLHYHPDTKQLTFSNGKMISPGPDGNRTPVELPYYVNPDTVDFNFDNARPNYKEVPKYYLVLELPDRQYYRNVLADEAAAPPFGDIQLRCYYPELDKDINITNALGDSPLESRFNARIIDCWKIPGENGLMLIIWSGGRRFHEFTYYRVDDRNEFIEVDYTTGRRNIAVDNEPLPEQKEVATMVRVGHEVQVYDPRTYEKRVYDLSGKRLR